MRILILLGLMLLTVLTVCEAKMYVALDKSDGKVQGVVDIDEMVVGDWSNSFIMVEANESYRGAQGHEVKYENKKLRKATTEEVNAHKQNQAQLEANRRKEEALTTLGINAVDIEKIKKLP